MNIARPARVRRFMTPRRFSFAAALALGAGCALGVAWSTDSLAEEHITDEHFDLLLMPGHLKLTAKGEFHINQDYPWKLVIGDVKLDKTKFVLSEKTASVDGAPKGKGVLKGAVCSKDACHKVEREVVLE
jgi:hypothetical protein